MLYVHLVRFTGRKYLCMYNVQCLEKKKHVGYEQKQAGEPPPWEMRIHNTKIIHHSLFMSRGWVLITFTI